MVCWLVFLPSLPMAAVSNVGWQGSMIWQCKLEGGARYVNIRQSVHYKWVQLC